MKNKRIMISSNLYRPNIGGAENSMYNLAIEYSNLGYEVDIVSSDMNNVSNDKLPEKEVVHPNVTVYRYRTEHPFVPRTLYMYYTAIQLYRYLLRTYSYEFLFARFHFNVITAWLSGMRDIRYLLAGVVRNQRSNERASLNISKRQKFTRYVDNKYHHLLQKIAVMMAKHIMVFSQNMVNQMREVFSSKGAIPIVKPGVDLERFCILNAENQRELRLRFEIPENSIVMLGLGRFVQSKGYEQVIEALPYLPENFIFCLVGQGVEYETYRNRAIELNVLDKLVFFPPTNHPEHYYQISDVFMMTSIYETLGQTILEAQACGLPIVAFEPSSNIITATKEITNDTTTVFCQSHNTSALVDCILAVRKKLTDQSMNRVHIRQFIINNFSWRSLCQKIYNVGQ